MSTTPIPSYNLSMGDDLALPFKLLRLDATDGGYDSSEPHRHNYHEIFYFVKGGGWHDIDFRTFPIRDHSIHFVNPGQVHRVRRAPESHGVILLFRGEFLTLGGFHGQLPLMLHSSPEPVLRAEDPAPFLETLELLGREFADARQHREEMLRSYLTILLLHARRLQESSGGLPEERGPGHELIDRLRVAIEQNFHTIHSTAPYAAMLCVSQNHLNSTARRMTGSTVGDLIHQRIILETKRLLYHTTMSIKEIAFLLNYDDPSYFTRFFRNHTGLTPQEFREEIVKKHP